MEITTNTAPKTFAEANQIIELLRKENEGLHQHNEKLIFQIKNFLHKKYGKKSEQMPDGYTQLTLFSMAAAEELTPENKDVEMPAPQQETVTYTRNKRNGHRQKPKDLPVMRIEYQLKDLTCPCGCGNKLHKIGEVMTEQLEMVPAKIFVKQHVRFKYAGCVYGDKVLTATMPNQPIDKCWAGAGLLANVLVDKYDDHLPLHRQSERLARHGIELSRKTLSDWVMQCADRLEPLVTAMKPDLLSSYKIHTDDTVIPVQEEGRSKTKEGRLWCYIGCSPQCVIYDYSPNRQQKWAENFLEQYEGYLQADAYTGYDKIYKTKKIVEVACMAHARRKFNDVAKTHGHTGASVVALNYIAKLYKIEAHIKELSAQAKKAMRKRKAKSILKEYKKWLLDQSIRVLPKSPLGQAIAYTLKNWIALTRYLANGILDIDNNRAERMMRPVAVGRKNWIFTGSDRGGVAAATIYSLIETCKLHQINPYDYLSDVLARLPNTLQRDIKSLLPYNWK
jgi:transposase